MKIVSTLIIASCVLSLNAFGKQDSSLSFVAAQLMKNSDYLEVAAALQNCQQKTVLVESTCLPTVDFGNVIDEMCDEHDALIQWDGYDVVIPINGDRVKLADGLTVGDLARCKANSPGDSLNSCLSSADKCSYGISR